MRKSKRFDEVVIILNSLFGEFPYPHSVVTELLFSVRFVPSSVELRDIFFKLVNGGYHPFSFQKNSKEYIQVKNIIKIIDHAQEKKNK